LRIDLGLHGAKMVGATMTMRTRNCIRPTFSTSHLSMRNVCICVMGEKVRLLSRYGETTLPARINSAVKPGEFFTTFHTAEVFFNNITSPYRERYVLSPEYKVTAVQIEKIS